MMLTINGIEIDTDEWASQLYEVAIEDGEAIVSNLDRPNNYITTLTHLGGGHWKCKVEAPKGEIYHLRYLRVWAIGESLGIGTADWKRSSNGLLWEYEWLA